MKLTKTFDTLMSAVRHPGAFGIAADATVLLDPKGRTLIIHRNGQTHHWTDLSEEACEVISDLGKGAHSETLLEWSLHPRRAAALRQLAEAGLVTSLVAGSDGPDRQTEHKAYFAAFMDDPDAALSRLQGATVAVVGLGGLGCEVVRHLAAAGVGRLACIDRDVVEVSNLNRQHCYSPRDIGWPKALAMKAYLSRYAPEVKVAVARSFVRNAEDLENALNGAGMRSGCDMVVCCADEPVGSIEIACIQAARRIGAAVAVTAMHIGRGYWGLVKGDVALELAEQFFRAALDISASAEVSKVRGSASWENAIIGSHMAGAVVTHLAGLPCSGASNRLIALEIAGICARTLVDFSNRHDAATQGRKSSAC